MSDAALAVGCLSLALLWDASAIRGSKVDVVRKWGVFHLACALCALPVLLPDYPAMVDLPQHVALIEGVKGWLDGSWPFAALFDVNFFTPYLLGYGLIQLLSYLVGITVAAKLVIASVCVALPWAAGQFLSRAGVDPLLRWPLLITPFGFAYDWGFLNFIVALPLGFLFLISVLDWRDAGGRWRWVKVVLWLHFLFFAHLLVAGFFSVMAAFLLLRPWRGFGSWVRAITPLMAVAPAVLAWMAWSMSQSSQVNDPIAWALGVRRAMDMLVMMVASPAVLPGAAIALLFLALPWLMGLRPGKSPAHWGPFAFFILWMMFFPNYVFGNFFSYQRFGTLGLPLYYLLFQSGSGSVARPLVRRQALAFGCALVSLSMLGWHGVRASLFDLEVRGYREVISHARPEGRLLHLALDRYSVASSAPLFLHFAGWYQAEQRGLAELSFAKFWVTPLKFRDPAASDIELGFEWYPQTLDWKRQHGERYDYVLVRSHVDQSAGLVAMSGCQLRLAAHSEAWWLYERSGLKSCPE